MRLNHILFASVGLAATLPALGADVTGKVVLKGTPKPELTIDMGADPKCGALHDKPVTTRHYVTAPDGGLANVLVFVKSGLAEKNFPAPTDAPTLDQSGCEYSPYVMGLRTQQKLKIKNSDPTLHNIHAIPNSLQDKGTANKEFNLAQPIKDMVSEKSFDAPEVAVKFKCDVHPWMFAYVGVFDHPFYAVTGKDGTFKISGLPKGKYTLEAYHVKTHGANPGVAQEITVDGDARADFTIELK
jgi:hypothetical protein